MSQVGPEHKITPLPLPQVPRAIPCNSPFEEPPKNVYQRIQAIMSELSYIQKEEKTVNGQYRYASHDRVTAALHPLLVKHGLVILPTVEEIVQDGNRTQVKLLVSFINVDDKADSFTVRHVGYGIDGGGTNKDGRPIPVGDKGPGKAISYAFKYACLKVFCLETGDDPDSDASASYEPPKCLEFEAMLPTEFTTKDRAKLEKFLEFSAHAMGMHVEDVKREALKRPADFLAKFAGFVPKKKD